MKYTIKPYGNKFEIQKELTKGRSDCWGLFHSIQDAEKSLKLILDNVLKVGNTISLNGRNYTIEGEVDLSNKPNVSEHLLKSLYLKGVRGAEKSLYVRRNGSASLSSIRGGRCQEV